MVGKWTDTGCHTLLPNISHLINEAKDDTSEDLSDINGTGTGHEVNNKKIAVN